MIGNRKERAERFFLAGASAGGLVAGSVGGFGASIAGATLALGKGRTSAVGVAFEDMASLLASLETGHQTEPFGSMLTLT
jgi:threonine dehydratase